MTTGESKQSLLSAQRRSDAPPAVLPPQLSGPEFLFNRELSLLEFHRRVLEEALDGSQPLLERLKFLSIFATNLDEFFMIRVSGLKEALDEDPTTLSPDGLIPAAQLHLIRENLLPMLDQQMRCLREDLLPQLKAQGIEIAPYDALTEGERERLDAYFAEDVFPMLTPLAVDPSHPFPYISNLSLNLGWIVEPLPTQSLIGKLEPRFVRIKVPTLVPRLVKVDAAGTKFMLLEDLIAANAGSMFSRMNVGQAHFFRITRDADIEVREDRAADLLQAIEQTLRKRRFGTAVRLEVSKSMPYEMVQYLTGELGLAPEDVYVVDGLLKVDDLMWLYEQDRPELKDRPLQLTVPAALGNGHSIFDVIKKRDVLLHHPYTSYSTVVDFINAAAQDPDVLAIKMCLYRTGQDSPIPQALIEASERGKQVTAIVEIIARFTKRRRRASRLT